MSDRVCQFFLRGRCQRDKCEFRHPADRAPVPGAAASTAGPTKPELPGIVPEKRAGFDSDEDVRGDSDNESVVSGFTEAPKVKKPVKSDEAAMPPPAAVAVAEVTLQAAVADAGATPAVVESIPPAVVETNNKTEAVPDNTEKTAKAMETKAVPKKDPSKETLKEPSTKETSTFIASAAAGVEVTSGTPILSRRAVKLPGADKDTEKDEEGKKEIRRNSKGFERFEDYFSDSEDGESTVEKTKESNDIQNSKDSDGEKKNVSSPAKTTSDENDKNSIGEKKKKSPVKEKQTVADLSKDWDEDDGEGSAADDAAADADAEETIESIVNFIQDENQAVASNPIPAASSAAEESGSNGPQASQPDAPAVEGEGGEKAKSKEEWVTLIFGEDGKQIPQPGAKPTAEKSVYDLDPEVEDNLATVGKGGAHYAGNKATPKTTRRKDNLAKKEGVTKIGNNVYFYTGPKDEKEDTEEDEEELEEEEMLDEDDEEWTGPDEEAGSGVESTLTGAKRGRGGRSYAHGRRKHSTNYVYGAKSTAAKTRRCGECEGCNREDCAECPACLDKPKFGGKGQKKQACVHRVCTWKNPGGKKGAGAGRGGTPKTPKTPGTPGRGRGRPRREDSINVTPSAVTSTPVFTKPANEVAKPQNDVTLGKETPSAVSQAKKRGVRQSITVISPAAVKERLNDKDLPPFDPQQFKPGCPTPIVKKGDEEYHIIVSGIKDTGLCGKYWGDLEALPSKRKRVSMAATTSPVPATPSPTPSKRGRPRTSSSGTDSVKQHKSDSVPPAKTAPTDVTQPETVPAVADVTADPSVVEKISQKRKSDSDDVTPEESKNKKKKASSSTSTSSPSKKPRKVVENTQPVKLSNGHATEETAASATKRPAEAEPSSSTSGQNRGVSCLADQNTQREVVVECFAPYDDHRWVNIGKERDGMRPDAVQYARALRPPYHLLSFLRIKGSSTKGMSCTDKNTMVFVVLEGEISVVLHTTEFNAKKGDSFYIPPKNYYNLINKKAREAELSLIQFQYDGPLPTVSAGSQSGAPKPPAAPSQPLTSS